MLLSLAYVYPLPPTFPTFSFSLHSFFTPQSHRCTEHFTDKCKDKTPTKGELKSLATAFTRSSGIPSQTHFSMLLRDSGPSGAMFNSSPRTLWDPLQVLILSFSWARCSEAWLFSSIYSYLLLPPPQIKLFLYSSLHLWSCALIAFSSFSAFNIYSSFFLSELFSLCLDTTCSLL